MDQQFASLSQLASNLFGSFLPAFNFEPVEINPLIEGTKPKTDVQIDFSGEAGKQAEDDDGMAFLNQLLTDIGVLEPNKDLEAKVRITDRTVVNV